MISKYKNTIDQAVEWLLKFARRFQDIRLVGQIVVAVIVIMVSWSGVKSIDANYQLQKQIATLQQENDVQSLENSNLKLQNDYYSSDQYLELSARQNFGLASPGETELLVPKNIAMSYVAPDPGTRISKSNARLPAYRRNLQSWVDFFLHRTQPQS